MDWTQKRLYFWPFDLQVWPWPWGYRPGFYAWHIDSWWSTFLPSHFKIHQGMAKLWTRQEKDPIFDIRPLSVTLSLELQTWVLHMTHCLLKVNISACHFKIHWRMAKLSTWHNKKDTIFNLWPQSVTLTLELQTLVLHATHCLLMVNISAKTKSFKIHWGMAKLWTGQEKKTLFFTFDLSVWPWPWSYRPGSCAQYIVLWWSTFLHFWDTKKKENLFLTFDL